MQYPRALHDEIDSISKIVSEWPSDSGVSLDDVITWVLQFDQPDFQLAIKVIKNINVLGQRDVDRGLRVAFSKLSRKAIERNARISSRNTLYAAIGDVGKSGASIAYHFRMNTEISEENFLNDETFRHIENGDIQNIVLMDDVIGTGLQATDEIKEITDSAIPLGVKNIFLLTVCGMQEAIQRIENDTKAYTFSAFEYSSIDTVSSLDANFYKGVDHDERESMRNKLAEYGKICYQKQPLGFGGIGGLLVMPFNTPNNTLPILWSDENNWIPLFRRVRRVNGISAYQSQFKKAASKKPKDESSIHDPSRRHVTLFVEGKIDELFFDGLNSTFDLATMLEAEQVSIVSTGGFPSKALSKRISETTPNAVFIVDSEDRGGSRSIGIEGSGAFILKLHPSCFVLLDLPRALNLMYSMYPNAPRFAEDTPEEVTWIEIERFVKRTTIERSSHFIKTLAERCVDNNKLENFMLAIRDGLRSRREIARKTD